MKPTVINYTETLVGYDIRVGKHKNEEIKRYFGHLENISPRLRSNIIWHSRFYSTVKSSWDTLVFTHFREPIGEAAYNAILNIAPSSQNDYVERVAVANGYSWQYDVSRLWDNPANMVCRYAPGFEDDIFAAFTVLDLSPPHAIACHGEDISHSDFCDSLIITPPDKYIDFVKQYPDLWKLLGYDVCSEYGFSPFISYGEEMQNDLDRENYTPWINRNNYLLFDTVESALVECRLANAYHEDCPFFIWGVYEAIDIQHFFSHDGLVNINLTKK